MSETWAIRITAGLFLSFLIYVFFPNTNPNPRPDMWEIQVSEKQTSILGLVPEQATLQDAVQRLQQIPSTAVFTKRQRKNQPEPAMRLEAYFEDLYDEGDRVILSLNADEKLLQHIKKQGFEPKLYPDDTVRINIHPDLADRIQTLTIKGITIIPGYSIDFEVFQETYGKPEQLLDDGIGNAHFLYPKLGLDFIQPAGGTQIIQFVTPALFDQELRQPLIQSLPEGAL